jgi:hypothetical protein
MKNMNIIINCLRCAAFAFSFALVATSAFAQTLQGPGAQNYGAGSSPQTGGVVSQPANSQINTPSGLSQNLYNSARGNKATAPHQANNRAAQ